MESGRDDEKLKLISHKDHEEIYSSLKSAIDALKQQSKSIVNGNDRASFEAKIDQLEIDLRSLSEIFTNQLQTAVSKEKKIYGHPEKMVAAIFKPKVSLMDLTSRVATAKKDAKEKYNETLESLQSAISALKTDANRLMQTANPSAEMSREEKIKPPLSRTTSEKKIDRSIISSRGEDKKLIKRSKSSAQLPRGGIVSNPTTPQITPSSSISKPVDESKEKKDPQPESPRKKF